jgi:ABC-type branched-subunit amino acid transport system substrate-binding protein
MADRLRIGACLSLTGRFAQFGRQAALGLEAWRSLDDGADLVIEDDRSDRQTLETLLPGVAAKCDLLLGPYSTILMRAAGRMAADRGCLVWNHGGSGDDVELAHPGHVVSVLTPTSRYAEPFVRYIAQEDGPWRDLVIVHGPGRFGRQVAEGAGNAAARYGVRAVMLDAGEAALPPAGISPEWDLFSAGVFEQDAELTAEALRLPHPPRRLCTISAGVRDFARAVDEPDGVFGIAQWFPGNGHQVLLGPPEEDFLRACAASGTGPPDYPATQAAAGAIIAAACARRAGSTGRDDLWAAAVDLETSTMFGDFKIDPQTGAQVSHRTVLVRWTEGKLAPVNTTAQAAS